LGFSWREPKTIAGPFTATVELAGPFKVDSTPYTIAAETGKEAAASDHAGKVRKWIVVLVLLILALVVVVVAAAQRKKR
jgi:hypothetical protein